MDDLVQFLRARLDEDEVAAVAATGEEWGDADRTQPFVIFDMQAARGNRTLSNVGIVAAVEQTADRDHIARHDPARVLAEVDAKRRMIDNYEMAIHAAETPPRPHDDMLVVFETSATSWRTALRLIALSYVDHPGYREEWRL